MGHQSLNVTTASAYLLPSNVTDRMIVVIIQMRMMNFVVSASLCVVCQFVKYNMCLIYLRVLDHWKMHGDRQLHLHYLSIFFTNVVKKLGRHYRCIVGNIQVALVDYLMLAFQQCFLYSLVQ